MEPLQGPCDPFETVKNGLVHTCTVHLCIWLSYVILFNEKGKKTHWKWRGALRYRSIQASFALLSHLLDKKYRTGKTTINFYRFSQKHTYIHVCVCVHCFTHKVMYKVTCGKCPRIKTLKKILLIMKNKNTHSIELSIINMNDKNRHRQKKCIQCSSTSNWLLMALLDYLCHENYTIHFEIPYGFTTVLMTWDGFTSLSEMNKTWSTK